MHPCIGKPKGLSLSYPSMCHKKSGPYYIVILGSVTADSIITTSLQYIIYTHAHTLLCTTLLITKPSYMCIDIGFMFCASP